MEESLGRRLAGSLTAVVVGLALLAGLWLLPDLTPDEAIPVIGQQSLHGRIVESLGTDAAGLPLFAVEILDGPDRRGADRGGRAGRRRGAAGVGRPGGLRGRGRGGRRAVHRPAGGASFIAEPWRVPTLWILAGVFAPWCCSSAGCAASDRWSRWRSRWPS
jgi:hypothetical protein